MPHFLNLQRVRPKSETRSHSRHGESIRGILKGKVDTNSQVRAMTLTISFPAATEQQPRPRPSIVPGTFMVVVVEQ